MILSPISPRIRTLFQFSEILNFNKMKNLRLEKRTKRNFYFAQVLENRHLSVRNIPKTIINPMNFLFEICHLIKLKKLAISIQNIKLDAGMELT